MSNPANDDNSGQLTGLCFGELEIGQTVSVSREITQRDIRLYAAVSGDLNPVHLDADYAAGTPFGEPIAHGMFSGALISAAIAMYLPGPGSVYRSQSIKFSKPVMAGDTLEVNIEVDEKIDRAKLVKLKCAIKNQHGKMVASGVAEVIPPSDTHSIQAASRPEVELVQVG